MFKRILSKILAYFFIYILPRQVFDSEHVRQCLGLVQQMFPYNNLTEDIFQ